MIQAFPLNTTEYTKRVHAAAFYLKQILHSKSCQGCCEEPHKALCLHTSRLLRYSGHKLKMYFVYNISFNHRHIDTCHDAHCLKSGCKTTKKLTNHIKNCGRSSTLCLICFIASSDKELALSVSCSDLVCKESSPAKSINLKESKIEPNSGTNSVNNICNCSIPSTPTASSSSTLSNQCENDLCYSKVPFQKRRV